MQGWSKSSVPVGGAPRLVAAKPAAARPRSKVGACEIARCTRLTKPRRLIQKLSFSDLIGESTPVYDVLDGLRERGSLRRHTSPHSMF